MSCDTSAFVSIQNVNGYQAWSIGYKWNTQLYIQICSWWHIFIADRYIRTLKFLQNIKSVVKNKVVPSFSLGEDTIIPHKLHYWYTVCWVWYHENGRICSRHSGMVKRNVLPDMMFVFNGYSMKVVHLCILPVSLIKHILHHGYIRFIIIW